MAKEFNYRRLVETANASQAALSSRTADRNRIIAGNTGGWSGSVASGGAWNGAPTYTPASMGYDAFMAQYTGAGASVGITTGQSAFWADEWSRMTPDQAMAATYGAGAVASVTQYLEALARGELYLTKNGVKKASDVVGDAEQQALGQDAIDAANRNQTDAGRAGSDTGILSWVTGQTDAELRQTEGYQDQAAPVPEDARPEFLKNPTRTATFLAAQDQAARQALMDVYFSAETDIADFGGSWTNPDDRARWLMENYPTLGAQAQATGLSPSEVATLTNFTLANDTALKILNEPVDWRAKQILFSVPETQRALVADLVTENLGRIQKQQVQDEINYQNKPWIVQRGQDVAGWLGSTAIAGLTWAWEQGQQAGRATVQVAEWARDGVRGKSFGDAWNATAEGTWDNEYLNVLSQQHGADKVNIIKEAWSARSHGDSDAYFAVLDKYADDPEAMALVLEAMNDIDADPDTVALVKQVAAATNDNLGNIALRGAFGMDPAQYYSLGPLDFNPFEISRDLTNVTAAFVLDPTLAAGVAGKAVLGAKYGVWALASADRTYQLFKGTQKAGVFGKLWDYFNGSSNVRRYFNWYGGELDKIRGLSGLERANATTTLLSQSKKYMSPEAFESMLKFGVKDADGAYQWIQGADNLEALLRGQPAKRGKQLYVPHMSRSMLAAKKVSLTVRGLDPTTVLRTRAERELTDIFGSNFVNLTPEEQVKLFVAKMEDSDEALRVGSLLSDYDGKRTLIGRVIDKVARSEYTDGYKWEWAGRYGWKKRKGESVFEFLQRRMDSNSRLLARMPEASNGIRINSAADANKVYEMMRLAGVPRYWASYFRAAWVEMSPAQRRLTMVGLTKTFGRAAGIDLVDPINGMNNLVETVTGVSSRQLYAPNMVDDFARIAAQAENNVAARVSSGQGLGGLTRAEAVAAERKKLLQSATRSNPSVESGISSAVWWGQTSNRMALPNFMAIDAMRARQSFAGAMLMRNRLGQGVTDYWTFATLAGPRFSLRNGVEDIGLYALTGGGIRNFWRGRQASTAIRESSERSNKNIVAAEASLQEAEGRYASLKAAGAATDEQLARAESEVLKAESVLADAVMSAGGQGQKLGMVKTSLRSVADRVPVLQNFILPHLTREEVSRAAVYAQRGNREALVRLMQVAFLRQKLPFIKKGDARELANKLSAGTAKADLSPRMQQVLDDLDDFVSTTHSIDLMDEASETARYLVDGTMPTFGEAASVKLVDGVLMRRVSPSAQYLTVDASNMSPSVVRGIYGQLHFALHTDGPKGQYAMTQLRNYFKAKQAGNSAAADAIVTKLAKFIENAPKSWNYVERFALASQADTTRLARATLDDLLNMFTTQEGKFNTALYNGLRAPTQQGKMPKWGLYYKDASGTEVKNLTVNDLAAGKFKPPMYAMIRQNEGIWVPEKFPFTDRMWSMMGRSLARMTREPIFISNYLDARNTLRPIEKRFIEMGLPPEYAKRKVADLAADRAYMLTMSYVDNPNVRSQLAFAVRNVARFYRAQEDFARRIVRTGENNPMAFWKALIAYEAVQDTGFVHKDAYGDDYFVYPGSQAAIEVLARGVSVITGADPSEFTQFPMVFGGKLMWITPSADPESWAPTLSSPWASMFIRPLLRGLPMTNALERELFGSIGENQGFLETVLPPNVRRIVDMTSLIYGSRTGGAEWGSSTLAANAARKAVLMLAAAGHAPKDGMTEGEKKEYRRQVDTAATGIMMMSFVLGLTAPASPQLMTGEVNDFARELGITGFNSAFIKELQNMDPEEDYMDVYLRWVERDPNKAIFTVSQSRDTNSGFWRSVNTVDAYLDENKDLVREAPLGASFFAPTSGVENYRTDQLLRATGLKTKRNTGEYMSAIVEAQGQAELALIDADYENRRRMLSSEDDAEKLKQLDSARASLRKDITTYYGLSNKDNNPYWNQNDYLKQWEEIVSVHSTLLQRGNELAKWASPLITATSDMQSRLGRMDYTSPNFDDKRDTYRAAWKSMIQDGWDDGDGDVQKQNLMKAATYAVWGPGGTTWPWSKPETSDQ